ncbi:SH3 domain-containing protein [Alkalibacterium sp. f15]|uniref:N-acetylglucosaminidase n=1 Tax=Alkalibacterium sp. f15 TaxID=3414029 RepID=UPI003BF8B3D5
MKQSNKKTFKLKYFLYSSAILAALAPSIEVEATEENNDIINYQSEDIVIQDWQILLMDTLVDIDQDTNIDELLDITINVHNEGEYELAASIYDIFITYLDLDENLMDQVQNNLEMAQNNQLPEDWVMSDELIREYSSISIFEYYDSVTTIETDSENVVQEDIDQDNSEIDKLDSVEVIENNDLEMADSIESITEDEVTESEEVSSVNKSTDSSTETNDGNDEFSEQEEVTQESLTVTEVVEEKSKELESYNVRTASTTSGADILYYESINAQNVSTAWSKAVEGYNKYPTDARFKDAIEKAAVRMLNYADSLVTRGNVEWALSYYEGMLRGPWLPTDIKSRTTNSRDQAVSMIEEAKKEALYNESINASGVSTAWSKAVEGYNTYPTDARFKDAIEKAAVRMLNYADSLVTRGNVEWALSYYEGMLRGPWLPTDIKSRTTNSRDQALSMLEEAKKVALYNESINASSVSTAWSKAVEGYNKYPTDARFKDAIGKAAVRMLNYADLLVTRGNVEWALSYYEGMLRGPWLPTDIKSRTTNSRDQALSMLEEAKKVALYNESINSSSVSTAWSKAVEGYNKYPTDARFKDAIEKAAVRMLNYADLLVTRGNVEWALSYYEGMLRGPWLPTDIKARTTSSRDQAAGIIEEAKKVALYNESINASGVSAAWSKAVEGYNTYPDDARFKDAIEKAAVRMLNYADSQVSKGNSEVALTYYEIVLKGPWLPENLKNRAAASRVETLKVLSSDYAYQEILNEKNTIKAWYVAIDAIVNHPDDTRIEDYIVKQANLLLSEAITLHKNYQYAQAVERYDALIAGPTNLYNENITAEKYKILAKNNLIPNNASYQNSYYQVSLETALNEQMKRAPQTQAGGKWVNASREQTLYYLNPDNFLSSIENDLISVAITGKVTASTLNVRSGSGTGHSIIDQIFAGKEVTIINEVNGWLQVSYLSSSVTKTGWVSSAFVDQTNRDSVTHEFTEAYKPIARINVATLNVRSGPGTNHAIFTTVSNGQRYEIVKASNNWYQIKFSNGQLGWVSGDFITVTNTLENELLQFLKLSGSSGINEAKLNEEIGNSGVLTGKGHVFLEASRLYNINEIYLLAHAKLETGNGSSSLAKGILVSEVDGKAVTPKVVYNMYGIAAFDSSPLKSGSEYAYKMGWDTVDKAIMGGAEWISKQYVNHATHKQDTLYKMRWNPLNPGFHQYATDIGWGYKQTHTLNTLVEVSQRFDLHLKFDMPVYNENK